MKRLFRPFRRRMTALTAITIVYWIRRSFHASAGTTENLQAAKLRTYENYATAHQHYRFWPDYLIELLNLPLAVALGIIALAIYLLGLVIAWPFGFITYYAATPAVYLGVAGIILMIGAARWGSLRAHHDYEYLRPVFTVDDATYYHTLDDWFSNFRSLKGAALGSLLFFIVGFVGLVFAYVTSANTRRKYHLEALRPNLFLPAWYSHRFEQIGFSLLLVFLILISITVGSGGWLLVRNIIFLAKLRRFPVIPMPTIVRARLRRLANLYVGTSLAWSLGVALFGILFYRDYSIVSGSFLAILFTIGLAMFALPQAICRSYIIRSHELLCAMCLAELYEDMGMSLQERQQVPTIQKELAGNLADLYTITDRPKTSVYDIQNLVLWIGSQLVALAAVLPHGLLAHLLHLVHL